MGCLDGYVALQAAESEAHRDKSLLGLIPVGPLCRAAIGLSGVGTTFEPGNRARAGSRKSPAIWLADRATRGRLAGAYPSSHRSLQPANEPTVGRRLARTRVDGRSFGVCSSEEQVLLDAASRSGSKASPSRMHASIARGHRPAAVRGLFVSSWPFIVYPTQWPCAQ